MDKVLRLSAAANDNDNDNDNANNIIFTTKDKFICSGSNFIRKAQRKIIKTS